MRPTLSPVVWMMILCLPACCFAAQFPIHIAPDCECWDGPHCDCTPTTAFEIQLDQQAQRALDKYSEFFFLLAASRCGQDQGPTPSHYFSPAFIELEDSFSEEFWMILTTSPYDGTQYGAMVFIIEDLRESTDFFGRPCYELIFLSGCDALHGYRIVMIDDEYLVDDVLYSYDLDPSTTSSLRDLYAEYQRDNE